MSEGPSQSPPMAPKRDYNEMLGNLGNLNALTSAVTQKIRDTEGQRNQFNLSVNRIKKRIEEITSKVQALKSLEETVEQLQQQNKDLQEQVSNGISEEELKQAIQERTAAQERTIQQLTDQLNQINVTQMQQSIDEVDKQLSNLESLLGVQPTTGGYTYGRSKSRSKSRSKLTKRMSKKGGSKKKKTRGRRRSRA